MKREEKPETSFGAPRVSPGLSIDPAAEKLRRDMEERGKYRVPVAGGPTPPIPQLDMPAAKGSTMADQANSQRMPPPPVMGGIVQPGYAASPGGHQYAPAPPRSSGGVLLPGDILPNDVRTDPNFRDGTGSMYATSQPELARKYGVIRSGRRVSPQELAGHKGGLSPETVKGLEAATNLQRQRQKAEGTDGQVEAAAAASSAGNAARFGQSGDEKPLTQEDRKNIETAAKNMDDFDFHTLREMMMKDILNNEEQRKLIEDRLEPMDLSEYVMNGSVKQRVDINSKLSYTFESVDGQVDLALKRLIMKEIKDGFDADSRYILDKYGIMSMACAIHSVNNLKLPDYRDNEGNFSDEKFWEKFNRVVRLGLHILASVGINSFWFDIRVRKLCIADSLGNG